jgi:uncharacterized protein (TIGR02266 family)
MTAFEAWDVRSDAPTVARRARPTDLVPERRAGMRLPIEVDVEVDGAAQRFWSTSVDLSPGGMFVMTDRDIPVGSDVMLTFTLPGDLALQVIGVVRWRRDRHDAGGSNPGIGLAFFCLEPEVKKILDAFCAVREPLYATPESGQFEAARPLEE